MPSQLKPAKTPAGVATERPPGRGGAEGEGTRAQRSGEGCGGSGERKRMGASGGGVGAPNPRTCAGSHHCKPPAAAMTTRHTGDGD